jgi:hypothetical protein
LRLMMMLMRWRLFVMMHWSWLGEIEECLLNVTDLFEELVNILLEFFDKDGYVWEDELEWVDILVLVVLDGILDLSMESLLLDVLPLNRLVPSVVEAIRRRQDLADVDEDSSDLGHDFEVSVAGVVHGRDFVEVEELTENVENVVKDSLFHVFEEDALAWVFNAPTFEVILNSLEVAHFRILVVEIDERVGNILDFIDVDGPEVFVHLLLETPGRVESRFHPVAEAVLRDDIIVLGVPSLDEARVHILQQKSVSLHMVQLWSITLWAVGALLEHSHQWWHVHHMASIG